MSLVLARSPGCEAKTYTGDDRVHLFHKKGTSTEIDLTDFCALAKYVLTNTDLGPDDPRPALVEFVKRLVEMPGWSAGGRKLAVPAARPAPAPKPVNVQPDWLRKTIGGMTTSNMYRVLLEGKRFAVIYCPGHTGYVDRMTRNKYTPTQYVLVEKGKDIWSHTHEDLHTGRLNKEARKKLEEALAKAERRKK